MKTKRTTIIVTPEAMKTLSGPPEPLTPRVPIPDDAMWQYTTPWETEAAELTVGSYLYRGRHRRDRQVRSSPV